MNDAIDKKDRIKAIEGLIRSVNKAFGDNSLYSFGKVEPIPVECVSTGSLALDFAIGGRERFMGIPMGRITELWGPKGSGKTSLCNHIIASAQKVGKDTFFLDFEHSYDPFYAAKIGVDIDKLLFGQYSEMEMGWTIVESIMITVPGSIIVVDSIAAMSPRVEQEGEMDDNHVARQAYRNTQAMRKLMGLARESNTALVITNQYRHKVGAGKYERSETQPGGEALRHALSLQIDLYPSKLEKKGEEVIARTILASIPHSKIARPYGKAKYRLEFGKGIDTDPELIEFGVMAGALIKKGAYYYMPGEEKHFAQGEDNATDYLREHADIADAIRKTITEYTAEEKDA
jgi:recombination protein RecA